MEESSSLDDYEIIVDIQLLNLFDRLVLDLVKNLVQIKLHRKP